MFIAQKPLEYRQFTNMRDSHRMFNVKFCRLLHKKLQNNFQTDTQLHITRKPILLIKSFTINH